MKSKFLKLFFAAFFSVAVIASPGCGGTGRSASSLADEILVLVQNLIEAIIDELEDLTGLDLSGLEETLESVLGLEDGGLLSLEEFLNSGQLDELLELGGSDDNVLGLLDVLDNLLGGDLLGGGGGLLNGNSGLLGLGGGGGGLLNGLLGNGLLDLNSVQSVSSPDTQVSITQQGTLQEEIDALRTAIEGGLPGGVAQLTSGMRGIGNDLQDLAAMVDANAAQQTDPAAAQQRTAIASLFRLQGRLLVNNADALNAVGDLDGQAYSAAIMGSLDSVQAFGAEVPVDLQGMFPAPLAQTRANLTSDTLPSIRTVMSTLLATPGGPQFEEILTSILREDGFPAFGGREGVEALLQLQ